MCGRPATEWIDDAWIAFDFLPGVAHRGAAVIAARKSSSAASAANATIEHARDLLLGTDWASMAVPSDGSYGVPEGLVSSFPCRCKDGDYEIIQGIPLSAFARTKIDISVAELLAEAKAAGCEVNPQ
ncbi:MAG: hypothetical protein CSA64_05420 [Arachnia propionica]|nr:MAG: hypothetical protein CSA64_05420 [Arachnia propionica]